MGSTGSTLLGTIADNTLFFGGGGRGRKRRQERVKNQQLDYFAFVEPKTFRVRFGKKV